MNKDVKKLIQKARRSIDASKRLLDSGDYDFSASRTYYAMFYCAEALLLIKKLSFSKHSGVISAFGRYYVKTNIFPREMHSYLSNAFEDRQISDYEVIITISKEQANVHIRNAEEFLRLTVNYLKSKSEL